MRGALPGLYCMLALSASASAQELRSLTQEEALARAERNAPDVLVSLAQSEVSRTEIGVAGMFPNPRIGIGAGSIFSIIGTLNIDLPIFGQRETAQHAALMQSRVAEADVEVVRLAARLAASLAWIDLWAAEREAGLAEADAERSDALLEAAQARVQDGSAPFLDGIRADADARRAHARLDALSAVHEAASAQLAVLLGEPPGASLLAAAGAPAAGAPPTLASLDGRLDHHPLSSRSRAAVRAAEAAVERDHRARWPLMGVSVNDYVFSGGLTAGTQEFYAIGSFTIPIFDEPLITRSETRRSAAEVDADAVRARLHGAAVAARANYVAAVRRCAPLAQSVVPAMRTAADRSQTAYVAGALDWIQTAAAEQARSDVERELLQCVANRARAWAGLQHALGVLDES